MRPTADMLTKILTNLRVNGKFDQDQLIIGRGIDEELKLMFSNNTGIRYTPTVTGERTFQVQMMSTDNHPVYGIPVTLYPQPKPVNDYTNLNVLAESTTVWVSEPLEDFPTTVIAMMVTSDDTENVAEAMAKRWSIRSLNYNTNSHEIDWNGSSGTVLICGKDEITWVGDEPSLYPTSPSDWNTTGYLGVAPLSFSMSNTEGSDAKLEYTTDGSTWHSLAGASGGGTVEYEPIVFTHTDLQPDGILKIQHDFNDMFPMCLGYTPEPRNLTLLEHQIVLDYNDQNGSNLSGAVWFVGSKQSMLMSSGPDHSKITVSGAGESDINGVYTFVPEEEYSNHLDANNTNGFTNTTMWANDNGVIFDGINGGNRMVFIYRKNPSGSDVVQYVASGVDQSLEIVDVPLNRAAGSTPVPTLTWGGN